MKKEYVFTSSWSNHPNGQDSKEWSPCRPPNKVEIKGKIINLYSEVYEEFLPDISDIPNHPTSGFYNYGDSGIKVKIEKYGNTSTPFGKFTKKVTFIFPKETQILNED